MVTREAALVVEVVIKSADRHLEEGDVRTRATYVRTTGEILDALASTFASPADLAATIDRLSTLALDVANADRASVFLLEDDGARMRLFSATGLPNEELWQRSQAMPSVALGDLPRLREWVSHGAAMPIADAARSD